MNNDVNTIKEIIHNSIAELDALNLPFLSGSPTNTLTKLKRLERWINRTLHKLSPYLVDAELIKFRNIAARKFKSNNAFTIENELTDIVDEFKEYFIELNDDLEGFPHRVVRGVPDEFAISNVFISYPWADDNVVLAIDQWLRNRGIRTKIDKRDFFAGSRIRDEIIRVMTACSVILLFYSEQSRDKPWLQFERELAADIEISAKIEKKQPPRLIYIVIDNAPLPNIYERNRIAIMARGKKFEAVCEEIYQNILQLPKTTPDIDLENWKGYVF
jgi:hypothetical protein